MRIKELREARALTQQQLADDLGVQRNTISRYETGEREPSLEMLEVFARYFSVDIDYLVGASDTKKDPTSAHSEVDPEFIQVFGELTPEQKNLVLERAKTLRDLNRKQD